MPSGADTVMGNNVKLRTGCGESWVLFAFERLPSPQEHSAAAAILAQAQPAALQWRNRCSKCS